MKLLVLDTETSDLEPENGDILEIGAAVYCTISDDVLWAYGTLIFSDKPNKGVMVNKITSRSLEESKILLGDTDPLATLKTILASGEIDAIVAHNADFDRKWIEKKYGVIVNPKTGNPLPWIDTCGDFEFPNANGSMKLSHLAVDHGIPIGVLHRALSDVLLTVELLRKILDLEQQLQIALGPRAVYEALVSFAQKDLAKSRGFRWDAGNKRWTKKFPLNVPTEPTSDRPFRIRRVK